MSMIPLDLASIGGGAMVEDVAAALRRVQEDLAVIDPVEGKREVVIKIAFDVTDKQRGVLATTHTVEVKLPSRKRGGVAWLREEGLVTEETCRDTTQMEIPETRKGPRMLKDVEP